MLPHIQLQEKQLFEHRQHLLQEAEQRRLLKQASQYPYRKVRHLFAGLRRCFTISGASTQQVERKDEFFASCSEEPGREPELQGAGR
jgi:hypothetical protein